jgi:hypothetical protein
VGEANKAFTLSIDKSERATSEQIKQQRDLLDTNFKAVNDKIDAIDKRVTRSEGLDSGKTTATTDSHTQNTWILALVLGVITIAGFLVNLLVNVSHTAPSP